MRSKPTRRPVTRQPDAGSVDRATASVAPAAARRVAGSLPAGPLLARLGRGVMEQLEARVHLSVTRDANGFTVVTPAADSRLVYVSAEGNDANDGSSPAKAVKTVLRARDVLDIEPVVGTRNNIPDQILFRRGDKFRVSSADPTLGKLTGWQVSGRSATEPFVIGAYTDPAKPSTERPEIDTGIASGFTLDNTRGGTIKNVYILGIAFEADTRDYKEKPAGFTITHLDDSQSGTYGLNLVGASNNLFVEDASFKYFRGGIVIQEASASSGPANFTVRRSQLVDNYAKSFGASGGYITSEGIYAQGVNGLTLDENVFDHNGWTDPAYGNFGSYPTIYNHDAYLHATNKNVVVTGNTFANAGSHGLQARAGGIVKNNLFINNPIAMSYGLVNGIETLGGVYGEVSGNVVYGARDINGQQRGWGIELGNLRPIGSQYGGGGTVVKNNIFSSYTDANFPAIQLSYGSVDQNYKDNGVGINDLTVQNNIVYGWSRGLILASGFSPGGTTRFALNNLKVLNNEFESISGNPVVQHGTSYSAAEELWSGNKYNLKSGATGTNTFLVKGANVSLSAWQLLAEPTASSAAVAYPDPTRSPATYNASIGGSGSIDAYLAQARRQSSKNWRTQYATAAAVAYIQAGFSGQRSDTQPPTGQLSVSDITAGGAATQTFTVTWADDIQVNAASVGTGDVVVTGPSAYNQTATLLSKVANSNGSVVTATYSIPAPGGKWASTANGQYVVSVAPNQVTDAKGNVTPGAALGQFGVTVPAVGTAAPTATMAAVAAVTNPTAAATLVVTYAVASGQINAATVGAGDLYVTGPNGFGAAPTLVSTSPASGNAQTIVATYRVDPPIGGWTSADAGSFDVAVQAGTIATVQGVSIGRAVLGTFAVDVAVPTAVAVGPTIQLGSTAAQSVVVTYQATGGINTTSLDSNDIKIVGPNGFAANATYVSRTTPANADAPVVVTYSFPAPAGGFTAAYGGTYSIVLQDNQVTATKGGAPAPGGEIGTFALTADSQPPVAESTTPDVYADSAATSISISVDYTDITGVKASTVGADDIIVLLPDGVTYVVPTYKGQSGSGTKITGNYALPLPDGIHPAQNGVYTIYLRNASVSDTSGNVTPDGAYAGEFRVAINNDKPFAPAASADSITSPDGSADIYVRYFDEAPGIDPASLGDKNILVSNNSGFLQYAELISADTTSDDGVAYAIYRLSPPAGGWLSSQNGVYQVTLQAGQVRDLSGNVADADPLFNLTVSVPNTFSAAIDSVANPQPGLDALTIRFSQVPNGFGVDDLTLKRDGGANLLPGGASLVKVNNTTYQLTGLAGLTTVTGQYVLTLPASATVNGDGGAALQSDASYSFAINAGTGDTTAPTYSLQAADLTVASTAAYTFSVVWSDNTAVGTATLGSDDLTVTGPGGSPLAVTFVSVDSPTNGTPRTATYSVAAPANGWTAAQNGTYTVAAVGGKVADLVGNAVATGTVGTFAVNVPAAPTDTTPPIVAINAVTTPRTTPVDALTFAFSEPVTGFDVTDLTLTRGGTAVALTGATLSTSDGQTYVLSGLTALTTPVGTYSLAVGAAGTGVADAAGNLLSVGTSVAFVVNAPVPTDTTPPTAAITPIATPRTTPVASVTVTFSEVVSGFDASDLTLTRNGSSVTLSGLTLASADGKTFTVSGLTAATTPVGSYALAVKASGTGISDAAGNALSGAASFAFIVNATVPTDTTPPTATLSPVTTPRTTPVDVVTVAFSEPVTGFDAADLALTRGGTAVTLTGLTVSSSDGMTFTVSGLTTATTPAGAYVLTLKSAGTGIVDAASNAIVTGATTSFTVTAVSAGTLADGGFEQPALGVGIFQYNPAGAPWTYAGGSGVTANGSGFTNLNPVAPEAAQAAFLQIDGAVSQAITGLAAGRYVVTLKAAQRSFGGTNVNAQTIDVRVDGASVGSFAPAGTAYESLTTAAFTVAAGTHTLSIVGLNPLGGDNTAFVDDVKLTLSPVVVPPVVPPTIPATNPAPTADLYNSTTDKKIAALTSGYVIDMSKVGTKLNILGYPATGKAVGSIRFLIDGVQERVESTAPYTIGGDNGADVFDWTPPVGQHTLQLVQYSGANATGTIVAASVAMNLTVLSATTSPPPGDTTPPTAAVAAVTTPRTTPVDGTSITFSEPVTGFDVTDLTLTRGGSAVALTGASLATTDNKTFTLTGLAGPTAPAGSYVLAVKATGTGIVDAANNAMTTAATAAWTVNDVAPAVTGVSPNPVTGSTSAQSLVITGTNFGPAATVTLRNLTTPTTVTAPVVSRVGTTQITVTNVFGTSAANWTVEVLNGTTSSGQYGFSVAGSAQLGVAVNPNPATGTTAVLTAVNPGTNTATVFGWSVTAKPTGATTPTFSANNTNAAKSSTMTFFAAGSYTLKLTSTTGSTVNSVTTTFTVDQTATTVSVTPGTATVARGGTQQFAAAANDQFGAAMATAPAFTWAVDAGGIGSVAAAGLYAAPAAASGSATVRASVGSKSGTATVTVPSSTTTFTPVKVNFQTAAAPAVSGYLVDAGNTYAARNGQSYGWSKTHVASAVDRNVVADQLLDTDIGVYSGAKWELAVPNGTYVVKVSVGDAKVATTNTVVIEGTTTLFSASKLAIKTFANKTATVTVTDGKLTLSAGSAADLVTRVNYIEVSKA
ncbi:MAG: conserved repeat domain protein [Phycisphaerales bacterium]|nr:conserved repeat domain protein [Phycisphaerales bacterium]